MKIAITQLGRIGDLVLATSAINIIKNKEPNATIDFIVGASNYHIIKNNPNISRILVLDKSPLKLIPFIFHLKRVLYDFYIDPKDHYSRESSILARLVNAVIKVGFNDNKKIFDIGIPSDKDNINLHFIERLDNTFSLINFASLGKSNRPNLFIDNVSAENIKKYLEKNEIDKYLLLNISASRPDKMWLVDKWIEFINTIKVRHNLIIISEAKHLKQAHNIVEQTGIKHFLPSTLSNIAALISNSKLLISPDTSLIHIASTFDIPVISLANNIPSNIVKFAPLSPINRVIFPSFENLLVKDISIKQVIDAFDSICKEINCVDVCYKREYL
jgi:ADP-heptose:LPS heptosyltransferase